MNTTTEQLLQDILSFFDSMGVREGVGRDGILMARVRTELHGKSTATQASIPYGSCPVCGSDNILDCDCSPEEQMKVLQNKNEYL